MSSEDTCKYVLIGVMVIAVAVVLFSGTGNVPCINCDTPKESGVQPAEAEPLQKVEKVEKKKKMKEAPPKEKKEVDNSVKDIGGYSGSDYASF